MVAVGLRFERGLLGTFLFCVKCIIFPVIPDLFRDPARRVCGARGSFVWRGQFSHRADARWLDPATRARKTESGGRH